MRHGNERLKKEFLPKILAGEIEFAIGYSEPNSGSDLASLQLKATKTDGGWILNGQKRFTTSAHFADWYWVAARTDPEASKHKGITLFLVPMDAKGIEVVNMPCLAGERTNEVFLDDVFVADDYVVGELNKGFYYISEALDFERFTLFTISAFAKKYEALRTYLRTATRDGKPMRDDPEVRRVLARLATRIEVCKMHCLRVISKAAMGEVPNIEAAMFKLWLSHDRPGSRRSVHHARRSRRGLEARRRERTVGRPIRELLPVLGTRDGRRRYLGGATQHHREAGTGPPRPIERWRF